MPLLPSQQKVELKPVGWTSSANWISKEVYAFADEKYVPEEGMKRRKFSAKILGSLYVYASVDRVGKYVLATFVENELRWVLRITSEMDAIRIGELLWFECCVALRQQTKQLINEKLPKWVKLWIEECEREDRFIEPTRI